MTTYNSRRFVFIFMLGLVPGSLPAEVWSQDPANARMLEQPAVSTKHVAFSYDGDLWIADRSGANPRRLTSHEGLETSPRFSPDGQFLAFSGEYDGNIDVYVVPTAGGSPKRLTYHPDPDAVEGFTPDGTAVLFSSGRNSFTPRYRQLFTVSLNGGLPTQLPIPNGMRATYSPDGKKIAYIPIGEQFQQWKNYRGGTCSRIWIYDVADRSVQMVPQPEGRCNDTNPAFLGGRVYFRSDRNGEFNLFSFDPGNSQVNQHTNFGDFPINNLSGCADAIIFEQAGYLHLYDLPANASVQLKIGIASDAVETRERFVSGPRWIRNASISPSGSRVAMEYRGEIVTVPAEKGDTRNLTNSPGIHERSPAWSPDGQSIAYFSDAGGEYHLVIAPQVGNGDSKTIRVLGNGFYEEPKWSPDGKKISYRDNSWSLYVLDVESNRCEKICSEPKYGPPAVRGLHHSWSSDSQWIAYTVNTDSLVQRLFAYQVADNKSFPITDGLSEVSEPCFDPNGKYLYFLASTDSGPVKHWFAMSNNDMKATNQIYVAVLPNDAANPFVKESDEEPAKKETPPVALVDAAAADKNSDKNVDKNNAAKVDAKKSSLPVTRIDWEGLDQRILALPLPPAQHSGLESGSESRIYFVKRDANGERSLVSFSMKTRKPTVLLDAGVDGFQLSATW